MAAIRAVLVLALIAASGAAAAQQTARPGREGATAALSLPAAPPQSLGYDHRGRLVPQPRLAVNVFALSEELPASRTELRAYGKWMAETTRLLRELAVLGVADHRAVAAARRQNIAATMAELERAEAAAKAQRVDELTLQLKDRKRPRLRDAAIARAASLMARDAGRLAASLEQTRTGTRPMIEAAARRDTVAIRDATLAHYDLAERTARLYIAMARAQLDAAVGGTPDLWLWQAEIASARIVHLMLRDLRRAVADEKLPPAAGRIAIEEDLAAIAEWIRRGEIQVRNELDRLRTSTEPSLARAQWLEQVFLNYQRAFRAERAAHAWLAANVPIVYDKLAQHCVGACSDMRTPATDRFREIGDEQARVAAERYDLLAAMP